MDIASIWDVPASVTIAPLDRGGYNNALFGVSVNGSMPYVLRVYGNHANPKFIQHETVRQIHGTLLLLIVTNICVSLLVLFC